MNRTVNAATHSTATTLEWSATLRLFVVQPRLAAGAWLRMCVEYFAHRFVLHGVFPELTYRDSHHG
jgi:hypothetical protein